MIDGQDQEVVQVVFQVAAGCGWRYAQQCTDVGEEMKIGMKRNHPDENREVCGGEKRK